MGITNLPAVHSYMNIKDVSKMGFYDVWINNLMLLVAKCETLIHNSKGKP